MLMKLHGVRVSVTAEKRHTKYRQINKSHTSSTPIRCARFVLGIILIKMFPHKKMYENSFNNRERKAENLHNFLLKQFVALFHNLNCQPTCKLNYIAITSLPSDAHFFSAPVLLLLLFVFFLFYVQGVFDYVGLMRTSTVTRCAST